jgi:hypothetical protein
MSQVLLCPWSTYGRVRKGADKSSAFYFTYVWSAAQTQEFFLDELKKLEQRSHKYVELMGEYVK